MNAQLVTHQIHRRTRAFYARYASPNFRFRYRSSRATTPTLMTHNSGTTSPMAHRLPAANPSTTEWQIGEADSSLRSE